MEIAELSPVCWMESWWLVGWRPIALPQLWLCSCGSWVPEGALLQGAAFPLQCTHSFWAFPAHQQPHHAHSSQDDTWEQEEFGRLGSSAPSHYPSLPYFSSASSFSCSFKKREKPKRNSSGFFLSHWPSRVLPGQAEIQSTFKKKSISLYKHELACSRCSRSKQVLQILGKLSRKDWTITSRDQEISWGLMSSWEELVPFSCTLGS